MEPNPDTGPELQEQGVAKNEKRSIVFNSRFNFAIAAFLSAVCAFYLSLAINVVSTPYMHEHVSFGYFLDWLTWALPFAILCTAVVTTVSFLIDTIERKHFLVLIVPFAIELGLTFWFFVAVFGI